MERNYTETGKAYTSNRKSIEKKFKSMKWVTAPCTLPMMQGLGIKEVAKQLNLKAVTHVSYNECIGPCGLYGIRTNYKNGRADIYMVDEGSNIVIICSDFYPNEVAA